MEFWQDWATERSWKVLLRLRRSYDFTLLGGWAIYLYARAMKSVDIDLIMERDQLWSFSSEYPVKKTEFLRKYEARIEGVAIDIYVPYYSRLAIPPEDVIKMTQLVEGFRVPEPEVLLILKQEAASSRLASVKGTKDRVDILALLLRAELDFNKYRDLLEKYGLSQFREELKDIISRASKEFSYLGIEDPRRIKLLKKSFLSKI